MTKKTFLIFITAFSPLIFCAQITITDNDFKKEEKIYQKPIPFDSLSNWVKFDKLSDNKQYLGLQVFIPKSSINKSIDNRYVTITDVIYGNQLEKWWFDKGSNCSSCPKFINEKELLGNVDKRYLKMIFELKDEKTQDFFYFTYDYLKKNILVQFFENQKKIYKNKVFIYDDLKFLNKYNFYEYVNCDRLLYDIKKVATTENTNGDLENNGKKVKVKKGSKWKCTDVTLMKDTEVYSKNYFHQKFEYPDPDYFKYKMFYVFENDLGETIAFENINPLVGEQITNFKDFEEPFGLADCNNAISPDLFGTVSEHNNFILEPLYFEREQKNKIALEASLKRKKETERNNEILRVKNAETKLKKLIELYGEKYGSLIFRKQLVIGMDMKMCEESWGKAYYKSKVTTSENKIEIWHYSLGTSLYFSNNKLIQIVEKNY